ncbi:BON domain-containing protein [Actinomadura verrucosospora]|uniref:Transport-associated protein n=1 Tax=Actinomadura verrucosospora TaxID=46165 RepID=A0A7D3VW23_ACTVE|nr:BON domain-containing protein [Actinomadura verrucosospora]QKG24640.1 transport-associated protein [Actinomadura verrucosospora]
MTEYLPAHIQETLAARAHELGIRVDVRGRVVHLRGEVATEEQRREVEDAARVAAEGHEICNEVHVVAVPEPDGEERLS